MLVLSRKVNETIVIGKDIEVVVSHIGGGRVSLGVTAPKEYNIRRGELQAQPPKAAAAGGQHATV